MTPALPRRRTSRTLAVLVTLAAVLTAGAPSIIKIKPGDSLWGIAHRHGTTVAVLRRLNDLPGNMIYAGDTLKVPAAPAPQRRTVTRTYTVRPGDNLTVIARRTHVSIRTLSARNHLPRNGLVRIGQRLSYPATVTVRRSGATRRSTVTHNAGVRISTQVQESTARHRDYLESRRQPSKAEVRRMVARTARKHHVDPSLALAVAFHESGFQQGVVSPVDAIGVMQVLPSTGRALGQQYGRRLDLLKAQDNITAGVLLLQQLLRSTGRSDRALAGYYQGLGSVAARGLLPQTHAYIRNVTSLRPRFRNG